MSFKRFCTTRVDLLRTDPILKKTGERGTWLVLGSDLACQISYATVAVLSSGQGAEAVMSLQLGWPFDLLPLPQANDRLRRRTDGQQFDVVGPLMHTGVPGQAMARYVAPLRQVGGA